MVSILQPNDIISTERIEKAVEKFGARFENKIFSKLEVSLVFFIFLVILEISTPALAMDSTIKDNSFSYYIFHLVFLDDYI